MVPRPFSLDIKPIVTPGIKNIKETTNISVPDFIEEKINLDLNDYYYSNVIARASKTMSECRNIKIESKKTGTES